MLLMSIDLSAYAQTPTVILIPGSGASGDQIFIRNMEWITRITGGRYFGRFQDELTIDGIPNFVCPRAPDEDVPTIEERADACIAQIAKDLGVACSQGGGRNLILVGHSMGGLIARVVAQDPRIRDCVSSVLTISTPHRGTIFADFAIDNPRFGGLIGFTPELLHYLPELKSERSEAHPKLFAAQDTPDNPNVHYFSITASMRHIPMPPLEVSRAIISSQLKKHSMAKTSYGTANDGVVPEYSMEHGTILGHLDVYHWAAACVDPVRKSAECEKADHLIIPAIKNLFLKAANDL